MNIDIPVTSDEQIASVANTANTWCLNFITFALLLNIIKIMNRG